MTTIDRGRKISLTYRERGTAGRPTLTIDVSADADVLPHEHREDLRKIAARLMGVPLESLEGVEVVLRRTAGEHPHVHPAQPVAASLPSAVEPPKLKA
jgi:hypothetical protein